MFNKIYSKIITFIKENYLFLIIMALIIFIDFVKLPYEVEMPGGTIDLSDRIKVDGQTPKVEGSFNMAYVEVAQGNPLYVLIGLVNPNWEVIKTSDLTYSENETIEDSNKRDFIYLEQSKNAAILAGLKAAKSDYKINKTINNIIYVDEQAQTNIKIGDKLISCDGQNISSIEDIKKIVQQKKEGEIIKFIISRNGQTQDAYARTFNTKEGLKIGLMSLTTYDIESTPKVEIANKDGESGPSGGMMMALMIYNGLTHQDLTKGRKVVGTGTIDENGNVGEIGGVKYKIMGAAKAKADVFLVPKENYKEALATKEDKGYNIKIISISTLQDAIDYLKGA